MNYLLTNKTSKWTFKIENMVGDWNKPGKDDVSYLLCKIIYAFQRAPKY